MAGFDSHSKCARCRDKGLGDDPCVQKKECAICRGFNPEQIQQLSTPTYKDRKDKKATVSSSTPTLVDPAHVSVLGKVEKVKAVHSTPTTKKTKCSESPKPSANKKKSSSSKPSAEDLKQLDDKWAGRFSRLEAILLAKTFTVPVEPVVKPASDVTTSQKPFFDPGATTSKLAVEKPGPGLDQVTGEAVEEMQTATQPLGAPGAGIATQPVQAKVNHSISRVARRNLPTAPPSRAFSQELLRRWERAAREQTIMCNQAAGLSRCLTRVQDSMSTQLKTLHLDSKGKSSEKMKQAVNELEYLTMFNRSISQAMARTMQDLSEGIFINMANFPLARRDSYLDYLHVGVKQDTVNALRTSPVHLNALFPDQLITKAEEEISRNDERRSSGTSHRQQNRFRPYPTSDKSTSHHDRKPTLPAWKQIKDKQQARKGRGKASTFSQKPAKGFKSHK